MPPPSPPPTPDPARAEGDDLGPLLEYLSALEADRSQVLAALEGRHPELSADFAALRRTFERLGTRLSLGRLGLGAPPDTGSDPPSSTARPIHTAALGDTRMERLRARSLREERYQVGREIARGGMGSIRAVWDSDLRRRLAMKVMLGPRERAPHAASHPPDQRLAARFLEEAQITAQLDHPGILPVHEIGVTEDGHLFFTMPLVEGRHLGEIFRLARAQKEGWTITRAVGVLLKVAEAVAFAHARGVVHRDLKPENVMVGRFGETYVMDWGLARVMEAVQQLDTGPSATLELLRKRKASPGGERVRTDRAEAKGEGGERLQTLDGDIVGTPGYMAPEQARGERESIGFPADIYALGAMMYQLLSGHAPHLDPRSKASPLPLLERILEHDPFPLAQLAKDQPEELIAVATKAMDRDPVRRYPHAEALAEDLRAYLEGRVVSAYERGRLARARKWVQRNRVLATAYGLVGLSVLIGTAVFVRQQQLSLKRVQAEQSRTDRARQDAETARTRAEAGELAATLSSYAANMRAAALALESGAPAEARQRLEACAVELRDFEWHHLWVQLDTSLAELGQVGRDVLAAHFHSSGALAVLRTLDERRVEFSVHEPNGAGQRFAREFTLAGSPERRALALRLREATGGAVAFAPDGRRAAIGLPDGRLFVLSALSAGAPLVELNTEENETPENGEQPDGDRPKEAQRHVAWSADGEWLAAVSSSRDPEPVRVYRPTSGPAAQLNLARVGRRARVAAFDPRRPNLAVGFDDGAVLIYPVVGASAGEAQVSLLGHRRQVLDLAFTPDGASLATAGIDRTVRLWDSEAGTLREILRRDTRAVDRLLFSGDVLVGSSDDRQLTLWNARDGRELGVQRGSGEPLLALGLGTEGERLWGLDRAGSWRLWDARGTSAVTELRPRNMTAGSLDFSSTGQRLVVSRAGSPEIWDADALDPRLVVSDGLSVNGPVRFTKGDRFLFGPTNRGAALWDAEGGQVVATFVARPEWGSTSWTLDGSLARERGMVALGFLNGRIALYDLGSGGGETVLPFADFQVAEELPGGILGGRSLHRLELCERGQILALVDGTNRVRCLEVPSGRALCELTAQAFEIPRVAPEDRNSWRPRIALDPTGRMLAVSLCDAQGIGNQIGLFDTRDGNRLGVLSGHGAEVRALTFSPNSRRLASGSADGNVRIWDLTSQETLLALDAHEDAIQRLAFSADGTRFATLAAGGVLRIHETTAAQRRFDERMRVAAARRAALLLLGGERNPTAARAEESASEPVRRAVENITRLLADSPTRLNLDAWEVVRRPGAAREEQQMALARARAAVRAAPEEASFRRTLAVALYRVGELRAALEELDRAKALPRRGIRPEEHALRALIHLGLGEDGAAEVAYGDFEAMMADAYHARDEDARNFLAELESAFEARSIR